MQDCIFAGKPSQENRFSAGVQGKASEEEQRANARLIATAPELLDAVKAAVEMVEWFMEHSRQADHAYSELGEKLEETKGWKNLIDSGYNGLMASYGSQFEEAIAKATAESERV